MYLGKSYRNSQSADPRPHERRAILRRHLIYYLRVWDQDSGKLLGHVVDLTTDGLMLISEQPIAVGEVMDLEIRWQTPEGEPLTIRFKAQSRWSSNDANPDFFDTGFKLLDGSEEVLNPIREVIRKYSFQE